MRILRQFCVLVMAAVFAAGVACAQAGDGGPTGAKVMPGAAEQLLALANQSREQHGAQPLKWDSALAEAARQHCLRMAAEGPISHRYGGEPDLSDRAGQAGAHFSLIEENVAVASTPAIIHQAWMLSPGHRRNLLNPEVDHVGIAVVAARGVLYAVADYSKAVQTMSPSEIEARIAALIRPSGITILNNSELAREACRANQGIPDAHGGPQPTFVMRWQGADLNRLPQRLVQQLESGQFRQASVGSCPAQVEGGDFSAYRLAVLLY